MKTLLGCLIGIAACCAEPVSEKHQNEILKLNVQQILLQKEQAEARAQFEAARAQFDRAGRELEKLDRVTRPQLLEKLRAEAKCDGCTINEKWEWVKPETAKK